MDPTIINKYKLERQISEIIHKDNQSTAHFIWDFKPVTPYKLGNLELKVVTLNPQHETHFLLHKVNKQFNRDTNVEELYCEILKEVINILEKINDKNCENLFHYAIGWRDKSKDETKFKTITSYFSGKNFIEIMEKFYFEKCEDNIIVDSVQLIPDS